MERTSSRSGTDGKSLPGRRSGERGGDGRPLSVPRRTEGRGEMPRSGDMPPSAARRSLLRSPDAARARGGTGSIERARSCRSGARRQPRFARFGPDTSLYSGRFVSRFLDRLANGPADRGRRRHGRAHLRRRARACAAPRRRTSARPRASSPSTRATSPPGAELIETNTFGANRRKLARVLLDDAFEEINSAGVRLAREAREVAGRDVFIAGSIGPLGELEVFDPAEHGPLYAAQARVLEGRGVDLFMVETFFDLEELVVAVEAVRGVSSLPIVALLTFDDDAEITGGVGAEAAAARLAALDVAAIGTNHGAGPTRALRALRGDARQRASARRAAEHRPREPRRRPRRLPPLDARVLRRVRRAGRRRSARASSAAAAGRRRRRSSRSARRSTRAATPRATLEVDEPDLVPAPPQREIETRLARALREGEWVVSRRARPAEGRLARRADRGRARASQASGHAGFVDVNDNPMARARMNALMASVDDPARGRHRDDPPRHAARHDGDGARGRAARRARRGGPQRPRRDGRPAARRRLPRVARRLRGRLDRARPAPRGPQPGRGLRRQGDRRARRRSSSASPSTRRPTTSSSSSTGSGARSTPAPSSR